MITMGKITHKRIAGSSKSSAMMEGRRETSCFLCLLGNSLATKTGNPIRHMQEDGQTEWPYTKYYPRKLPLKFEDIYFLNRGIDFRFLAYL